MSIAGVAAREASSEPAHRGPGPDRGILRSSPGDVKQERSASIPSRKTPRFLHMATVHDGPSPQEETQSVARTLRPPGPMPKRRTASTPARPIRRNKENETASANLHQLLMDGPTTDTYTGTSGSQTQVNWDADAVPPSPSSSDAESPGPSPSKLARMTYRPPTPPLESLSAEPSELIEQAEGDQEPNTFLPRVVDSSTEPAPDPPASEEQIAGASTAVPVLAAGHEELPLPYSSSQLPQPPRDGEAGDPLTESALPAAESAQPAQVTSDENPGEKPQPAQVSPPTANDPPLHIITTPRKGRGIAASRPIPFGEIIVREYALIDELHDTISGGKRRIRES